MGPRRPPIRAPVAPGPQLQVAPRMGKAACVGRKESMNRRTVTHKEFMTLVRGVLGLLPLNTNRRARRARRRALDSERESRHDIACAGENARARIVAAR